MKVKIISAIILLSICGLHSQQNLDSLYSVWKDNNKPDSSRVEAFSEFIWDKYLFSQPDSALVLTNVLYEFSASKNYKKGLSKALNMQAIGYSMISDYPNAIEHLQRSIKVLEEIDDNRNIASSLNNLGNIYNIQSDYHNALYYYQKCLSKSEEINDKNLIASSLTNSGTIYRKQGDNLRALDYFLKSLPVFEELNHKKGLAATLLSIGNVYYSLSDNRNALAYFQKSLIILEELKDLLSTASALSNIGVVYNDLEDYPKALDYQNRGLKIYEEIGNKEGIIGCLDKIGTIHQNQNNYKEALEYYTNSLNISEEIEDEKSTITSLLNIGVTLAKQGYHGKSISSCLSALSKSELLGVIGEQKFACECLYDAYKAQGNSPKALQYHEQMLVLNDSLKIQETTKKLQQMEFTKQVLADSLLQVEKDLQVEMAHQEEVRQKDRNRNLALGAGIFFLVLSGGFYSRWRYVRKSKKIIEKEKDRSENLLLNILPSEIAEELKLKGSVDARDFDQVSVLFTDFKGFTTRSEKLSARELVEEINHCFEAFDHICGRYKIEKIKTIGDAYMAGGGLPVPSDDAVKNTVLAALEMQAFMGKRAIEKEASNEIPFEMRVGIHTGPVVAGIVGVKKFQYDIWGDTVNTASRMESSGEVGKINISQATYEIIKEDPQFSFISRGKVQAKGKGEVEMYFVSLTGAI